MGKKTDSLGDRMKGYENIYRYYLTRRVPVVIRLDGKAFHTFTSGMKQFVSMDTGMSQILLFSMISVRKNHLWNFFSEMLMSFMGNKRLVEAILW